MSLTKLLIAAVLLAGLGGLIFWVTKHPQDKTANSAAAPKLLDVPDTQLLSIEIRKQGSAPVTLTKEKGKWAISAPEPYSADQDATVSMVSSLTGVNAESVIEDNPADLAKYGLNNPPLTVLAHEKGGKTDEIFFGDDIPAGSQVYARVGKDPKVYSVSSSLKSSFNKELKDLRDKRLLTFDSTHVSRLELVAANSDIEFGKVNETEWQIVKPQPYRADSFQVDDLLRKLSEAKIDLSGKPADAKAGQPVATAKVTDVSGVQSLEVRKSNEDYYARSSVVAGTFKISSDLGKLMSKSLDELRNKKVFDFGFTDTTRLEFHQTAADKLYTRSGTEWKSNNQTMDPGAVQSLVDKLRELTATGFVTAGFRASDVGITVVSNDGKRTEKVELSKLPDSYVARREGQPSLYKLDAKSVSDILEAASAIKPAAAGAKK